MRNLFLACAAFGVASTAVLSPVPVQAQVIVRVPGVAIDTGPSWRQQHDGEWRDRREFRKVGTSSSPLGARPLRS